MTNENDKDFKIEFAPGCFDNFDGTQEELDEMIAEITKMFEGKTRAEIEENSRELTDEDWDELPDEVKIQLMRSFEDDDESDIPKRTLQ